MSGMSGSSPNDNHLAKDGDSGTQQRYSNFNRKLSRMYTSVTPKYRSTTVSWSDRILFGYATLWLHGHWLVSRPQLGWDFHHCELHTTLHWLGYITKSTLFIANEIDTAQTVGVES